jgi:hypothetical protein
MGKLLSLRGKNANLTLFDPEKWGEVRRFNEFYRQTHHLGKRSHAALRGLQSHFRRAESLLAVIKTQSGNLQLDREQEEKSGYSTHAAGDQMAALVESFVCELYSSVDCTNQVVRAAFPKAQGIADKTSGTFKNGKAGKLDRALPELIRAAFGSADWYEELRSLRTTATHSETGMCRLNHKTNSVEYYVNCDFHSGRSLHFEDIIARLDYFCRAVNQFEGCIFHELNATLKDDEQHTMCLIANGRFYHRWVRPSEVQNIHSGRCDSFTWFESGDNPVCPRAPDCGAYQAAKRLQSSKP